MENYNLILTQSLEMFERMGTPTCKENDYIRLEREFPLSLQFGKTYFIYNGGKLIAFKVLAYAFYSRLTTYSKEGLSFLIQTPNEPLKWAEDFLTTNSVIFDSVESFMEHQITGKGNVSLDWRYSTNVFPFLTCAATISLKGKVWKWDSSKNCPTNDFHPRLTYFVVKDNNLMVGFEKKGLGSTDYFLSKQECIKSRCDKMEIIDFADESNTDIHFSFEIVQSQKKVHTLRFIED